MKIDIPNYETKKELFDFLILNKETLISQKKSVIKHADGMSFVSIPEKHFNLEASKLSNYDPNNEDEIRVKSVINTTNFLDSHGDVHIPGIWNKSIKENSRIMHIQEHKSGCFNMIIASGNDLDVSVKTMSWKSLGYDAMGSSQALIFDSIIKRSRNSYMFDQYKQGFVTNHSVGMRYVKMELAINDKDYEKEKDFYDKYISQVINSQDAEKKGYFWVITEAKVIEGSAVPMGSNPITPTINTKTEPSFLDMIGEIDTQKEAAESTFNILDAINKTNF